MGHDHTGPTALTCSKPLTIPRCAWQRHRQIAGDGAIVVRPDRFIAWRHPAAASDPRAVLTAALSQILARPVGTPTASAA